uniref:SET domain-containing protein n=2 Tax=Timema TaxID=61471 RepID=A0A7R9ANX2_TIMSH|nr:unnamed protein product [Timema shepardi]CAD7568211.1 unnamed protein product [Timema californicum]
MVGVCAVCSKDATQTCEGCHLRDYCTWEHQQKDWEKHIVTCKPFKVERSSFLGRHLVSTRPIKSGEVVLKEAPLVVGPSQLGIPVCVGCYKRLTTPGAITCPRCGWPACGLECTLSPQHQPECEMTSTKRKIKVNITDLDSPQQPEYRCLTVLRCLYQREHDPQCWDKIMGLEPHSEKRIRCGKYEEDRVHVANFIRQFFQLEDEFSEEDILKICGVVQINSYFIPLTDPQHAAVYDTASFIEHNCRPNCSKTFTETNELMIRVAIPVEKGDHLSISYTEQTWGTARRRHHLSQELLLCCCERCKDPTELGTLYSAIRCRSGNCEGYLVPDNPLVNLDTRDDASNEQYPYSGYTSWSCLLCGSSKQPKEVYQLLKRVESDIKETGEMDFELRERLLSRLEGEVLHPNHYFLTELRGGLAQTYGRVGPEGLTEISDKRLERKMELCRQVLALADILFPAETRVRGMLMFELHESLAEETRRGADKGDMNLLQLKHKIQESQHLLTGAEKMLSSEPEMIPEGEIAVEVKRRILDQEASQMNGSTKNVLLSQTKCVSMGM